MIEVNRQGEVWIYAEQEAGKLSDVPLELLSKGRELADLLHVPHSGFIAAKLRATGA
jgi:electron transfer flavoprotein alpha subunit